MLLKDQFTESSNSESDLINETAEICSKYIMNNEQDDLIKYLIGLPENLRIIDIVNKEGFTLLHLAAHHNNEQIVEVLLNKVRVDCRAHEVALWVNAKTIKERFTALHFASKNGSMSIIHNLMSAGGDLQIKNVGGTNVLHLAAQAN